MQHGNDGWYLVPKSTEDPKSPNLAILGCGNLGEMLVSGLLASGEFPASDIVITDRMAGRAGGISQRYSVGTASNIQAVEESTVAVIAVKPNDVAPLLEEVAPAADEQTLFISVAAGIKLATLQKGLGGRSPVIRAMPNLGAAARRSMTALAPGTRATAGHRHMAEKIFRAVGEVVWVDENQMDAVTAVSGSGPAYFALLAEAMAAAGVGQGLEPAVAARLAVQTLRGTGAVLADSAATPEDFRKKVTSPGGTTEAAIAEMERGGFRELIAAAVEAARRRSEQLSR